MTLRIIGGKFKGRILKSPPEKTTRPTQGMLREAVFNICQGTIEGARFLDLFAGSGAMGLEALSRGAAHVTLVEKDGKAARCIKENIEILGVIDCVTLFVLDAKAALRKISEPFDIIYIDPPYDFPTDAILQEILSRRLLAAGATIFLEERYDPKNKSVPFQDPRLELKSSRRFGTALLHQYVMGL